MGSVLPGASSSASVKTAAVVSGADHPLGGRPEFWEFMCSAVEVEVDADTGVVDVTRLVLASDVGKALNPAAGRSAG